jgi:hypothetical protein
LNVAVTSFDFLNGGYAVARNTRLLNYTMMGLIVAALLTTVATHVQPILTARSAAAPAGRLQQVVADADKDVQRRYGMQHSETELRQHLSTRKNELSTALGGEVDFVTVARGIRAAAPADIQIVSLTVKSSGGKSGTAKSDSSTDPGAGAAAKATTPAGSSAGSSAAPVGATIEIKAKASDFGQVAAWISAMESVSSLRDVEAGTKWTGDPSGGSVQITTTATLAHDVIGARYNDIAGSLNAGSLNAGNGSSDGGR